MSGEIEVMGGTEVRDKVTTTRNMKANLMSTKMIPIAHAANLIAKTGQGNTICSFNLFLPQFCVSLFNEAKIVWLLPND